MCSQSCLISAEGLAHPASARQEGIGEALTLAGYAQMSGLANRSTNGDFWNMQKFLLLLLG
jgi:hypothetical protein